MKLLSRSLLLVTALGLGAGLTVHSLTAQAQDKFKIFPEHELPPAMIGGPKPPAW
ncbi:MAG: hypothetical protein R3F53_28560 [Gammaproteobacteria bacterium]